MRLSKYEQETIIIFNAGEDQAELYTREKAIMRKMDALVYAFPDVYKLIDESKIDKTYSMPKTHISFRKPRHLQEANRKMKSLKMKELNESRKHH